MIPVDDHSNALRTAIWPGDSDNNSPPTVLSSNAGEEEGGGRDPAAPFRRYMDSFAASGQKLGAYPPPTILPDPPRGYFYHPAIVTGEGIMGCFRGGALLNLLLAPSIYIYIFVLGIANGIIIVMGGTGVRNGCSLLDLLEKLQ